MKKQRVFWAKICKFFAATKSKFTQCFFYITSHSTSIAEAEEGATTDCVRTAAAHSHVLDFLDSSHTGGPHVKGNHLVNSGNVQK